MKQIEQENPDAHELYCYKVRKRNKVGKSEETLKH